MDITVVRGKNVIVHLGRFKAFAIKNISELFGYIATGRVNIRICRDVTGEIWFGVGEILKNAYILRTQRNVGVIIIFHS